MDFHLHPAPLAAVNTQAGWLGNHDQVRAQTAFIDNVLPAQTVTVFFLHGGGHVQRDIIRHAGFFEQCGGINARGNSALLIAGTASIEYSVLDISGVWVAIPQGKVAGIHGVRMSIQGNHEWTGAHPAK